VNCKDCVERLETFLDRELSDAEVVEVKRHMDECGGCVQRFEFYAELKRLIFHSCGQERAPLELRDKVGKLLA
jgi:mycothiol system anti-sigma-R factor